jgi:peptide-methionine (R)-S-oxide reductase
LDPKQLDADIARFDRRLQIFHFFKSRDEGEVADNEPAPKKCMIPKSTWTPKILNNGISEFCETVKQDILLLHKKRPHPNLSPGELQALNSLKKDENITIKPADKGGGIAVMNTADYLNKVEEMLNDTSVYEEVSTDDSLDVKQHADNLLNLLQQAGYISSKNLKFLTDFAARTPIFYGLPKLHKENIPLRPVVSQINGPTNMVNYLVDKYLVVAERNIPFILQDTTAFLQLLNSHSLTQDRDLLVTLDVTALYTNIPHEEGVDLVTEFYIETLPLWNNEEVNPIPGELLATLMKFILANTTFCFNYKLFKQKFGTTMGARFSVKFANIYMHKFFEKFFQVYKGPRPEFLGRLIDDVFTVWTYGEEKLKEFLSDLNRFHRSIKFTMEYSPQEVHFLDTTVYKVNNRIQTKIFTKATDKKQFLFFSSCHPGHITRSIPYAQSLRYRRNTTCNAVLQDSLNTLKKQFRNRGYPRKLVDTEINKCLAIPREETLVYKTDLQKKAKFDQILGGRSFLPLIITYYDQYFENKIKDIIRKHWNLLTGKNATLQKTFANEFPLVVFKKGITLGKVLTSTGLKCKWVSDPTLANLLTLVDSDNDIQEDL